MTAMILFYSDNCPHSKMLLETIKRHNAEEFIKCISIDVLRAVGKNLPQIHSVPALLILPQNEIIFGKSVFDYLLLPKTGKLFNPPEKTNSQKPPERAATVSSEPKSFSIMSSSSGFSDNFAMIDENPEINNFGLDDRVYGWATIDNSDINNIPIKNEITATETRSKRESVNLDEYRARRALELDQNHLNTTQLLPPTTSR
jgi:hypothetical protein